MTRLISAVSAERHRLFVGRELELRLFSDWAAVESPPHQGRLDLRRQRHREDKPALRDIDEREGRRRDDP